MGWPTKNPMDSVPDIRFVKPVTPEPSYPTIRGPFHGIDLPKDTPAGAFVRNAVEANAANLEEKLRKHLAERDINRAVAMSAKYKSEVEYMERAAGDNYDAEKANDEALKDIDNAAAYKVPDNQKWCLPGVDEFIRARKSELFAGTKHDADKPDAGTVLAGFWPLIKRKLERNNGYTDFREFGLCEGTLDCLFDTTVSISKRLTDAFECLSILSLEHTLRPGTYGARSKYGPDNFLRVSNGVNRYYQACGRHVFRMIHGETIDSEGLVHGECVIWCIWAGATHVLRNEQERLDNMGPM